jgi:hypothetical protein
VWRSGTNPSSTFGLTEVYMDHPPRMFRCARCHSLVLLCSRCDRGQIYCGRTCSGVARGSARRAAQARYQRSLRGRQCHAARQHRWRRRCRLRHQRPAALPGVNTVTHQGSPQPSVAAPLVACTPLGPAAGLTSLCTPAPEVLPHGTATPPAMQCRRCGAALVAWARQGFLRRSPPPQPAKHHDHSP